jgi:hypothetical protein
MNPKSSYPRSRAVELVAIRQRHGHHATGLPRLRPDCQRRTYIPLRNGYTTDCSRFPSSPILLTPEHLSQARDADHIPHPREGASLSHGSGRVDKVVSASRESAPPTLIRLGQKKTGANTAPVGYPEWIIAVMNGLGQ